METQKFEITGPGEYRTRAGEKAVVECIDGTDLAIEGFPITGRVDGGFKSWSVAGRYFHAGESPLDIVGPWVEPKAEPESFKITGPGEYRTRDGQKVVVTRVTPDVDGDAYPVVGKVEGETDPDAWAARGGIYGDDCVTKYERDIVGPWIEEGAVVDAAISTLDLSRPPNVGEMIEAIEKVSPAFAVGQTWKTRGGKNRVVTRNDHDRLTKYPILTRWEGEESPGSIWHAPDGKCCAPELPEYDLVEFVSHPEPEVEIAMPEPSSFDEFQSALRPEDFVVPNAESLAFQQWPDPVVTSPAADAMSQAEVERLIAADDAQSELAAFDDDRDEALETMAAALRVLVRALDRHGYAPGSEVADAHRFASLTLEGFEP